MPRETCYQKYNIFGFPLLNNCTGLHMGLVTVVDTAACKVSDAAKASCEHHHYVDDEFVGWVMETREGKEELIENHEVPMHRV